jgi:hypothetical protein
MGKKRFILGPIAAKTWITRDQTALLSWLIFRNLWLYDSINILGKKSKWVISSIVNSAIKPTWKNRGKGKKRAMHPGPLAKSKLGMAVEIFEENSKIPLTISAIIIKNRRGCGYLARSLLCLYKCRQEGISLEIFVIDTVNQSIPMVPNQVPV